MGEALEVAQGWGWSSSGMGLEQEGAGLTWTRGLRPLLRPLAPTSSGPPARGRLLQPAPGVSCRENSACHRPGRES